MNKIFIFIVCFVFFAYADSFKEFEIEYRVKIPKIKGDLSIWIPLPQNTPSQKILDEKISSPAGYSIGFDNTYNNRILYVHLQNPDRSILYIKTKVRRYEVTPETKDNREYLLNRALSSTRYIPLSLEIKNLAQSIVKGKKTVLEKAKALYFHTLDTLDYDKSVPGWGQGNFFYAKEVCKGNCTDFHTYFITLARNVNIPSIFVIGFSIPEEKKEGKINGYHCWAGFWNKDRWIYVDISEADKKPELKEYYFGNLDPYRVEFSVGRDIVLNPPQKGKPLNYFIYPYAELDGSVYEGVDFEILFKVIK